MSDQTDAEVFPMRRAGIISGDSFRSDSHPVQKAQAGSIWGLIEFGLGGESVEVDVPLRDAIATMLDAEISEILVTEDGDVRGAISLRALAEAWLEGHLVQDGDEDLTVEDFMSRPIFCHPDVDMEKALDLLEGSEGLVVGSPDNVRGYASRQQVLRYYSSISEPFVLIQRIELLIRQLITKRVRADRLPEELARVCKDKQPRELRDVTLAEAVQFLVNGELDKMYFTDLTTRKLRQKRLGPLPKLRNDVLHFRRDILPEDIQYLRVTRNWLEHQASKVAKAS